MIIINIIMAMQISIHQRRRENVALKTAQTKKLTVNLFVNDDGI